MPPPYSLEFLASVKRTITEERLRRYLTATGHNLSQALELYEYNVQISEALYGLLHGLEVTVRNAEHHALSISYNTPLWYDSVPLTPYWKDRLREAKAKPGANGRPGKIIAELTFGFWVDLIKQSNHRSLWVDGKLNKAFPHARRERSLIHERLKTVQLLRNRVSHHEPVLTSGNCFYTGNGTITLVELLECVEWVSGETAQWMKSAFRYVDAERILHSVAARGISF